MQQDLDYGRLPTYLLKSDNQCLAARREQFPNSFSAIDPNEICQDSYILSKDVNFRYMYMLLWISEEPAVCLQAIFKSVHSKLKRCCIYPNLLALKEQDTSFLLVQFFHRNSQYGVVNTTVKDGDPILDIFQGIAVQLFLQAKKPKHTGCSRKDHVAAFQVQRKGHNFLCQQSMRNMSIQQFFAIPWHFKCLI